MKTASFLGKAFEVEVGAIDGMVVPHGASAIYVNPELKGVAHLDAAVHEALHACFCELREDTVNRAATDIARWLWRLGYRKEK
jgi:hypothetical protein